MHKVIPNIFIFLDQYNNNIFENSNTNIGIIYRNYHNKNRKNDLLKVSEACKQKRLKLFVSNDIKLAIKVKADGIYIPSFKKLPNFSNLEKKNILILGSAHNEKEIQQKIKQKCKGIFLSPVFYVKKNNSYLDILKFNFLSKKRKINFFALGGINENNIAKLKLLNIRGFGGISLFKKKPAYKRPVFLKNNFF